jgi:carbamoyltransferase
VLGGVGPAQGKPWESARTGVYYAASPSLPRARDRLKMLILGVNAASHNTSAALLRDGRLIAFAEEERFNREKYTFAFPEGSIRYCLEAAGATPEDVDVVAFAGRPWTEIGHSAWGALRLAGRPWYRRWFRNQILVTGLYKGLTQAGRLRKRIGVSAAPRYIHHHVAHAASSFYCSPYEEAAILTLDAQGDGVATGLYVGRGNRIERVETWAFPEHSLGHFYDCVGEWLGFRPVKDAGKVMGLASYGNADATRAKFDRFVTTGGPGGARFDLDWLKFGEGRASERFIELFGPPRRPDEPHTDARFADVAAGAQRVIEEAVMALARAARERTGLPHLCLAGGVALNSVANGKLTMEGVFDDVWVQPASYDAGLSLGAALEAWHMDGGERRFQMDHAYWGSSFTTEQVREALERSHADYREVDDPAVAAAELLAANRIVGWFQGRAEVGPRALGNRSILANPAHTGMKDIVNKEVKHREAFRPFAPSCVMEDVDRWFHRGGAAPFMLKVWEVRDDARELLPAITHVDGTARLQTVERESNPLYHRMLVELGRRTGIPCSLNTSFNIRGEAIVDTPIEALQCYYTTGLDALVIDRFVLEKPRVPER